MVPIVIVYKTSKTKNIWRKFVILLKGTNQISSPSPFWLAACCSLEMGQDIIEGVVSPMMPPARNTFCSICHAISLCSH